MRVTLIFANKFWIWAVVVAQLVEQLRPTPEIHGSNPVISKFHLCKNSI